MNKVIVETKSRSKHVFEVEDSDVAYFNDMMFSKGFNGDFILIKGTYFNPDNITSVKIEEVG